MIKFAVCDDEREMLDCISDNLHKYYPDECEIKTYTDGASLLSDCRRDCFDALFLDIGIPGLSGMEIAEKIRENDRKIKIIFVSQKIELAYKGYKYDAFRFVRKNNLEQDICEAAKSLSEAFSSHSGYYVFRTTKGEAVRDVKDIKYLEAKEHFINMVCDDGTVQVCGTLREYEERMRDNGFIRIHKSYLVNFRHIHFIEKNSVLLNCGKKLPLSRYRVGDTKIKIMFFSRNITT